MSFFFVLWFKRPFVRWAQAWMQPINRDVCAHHSKRQTPTMGGIIVLLAVFLSSVMWMVWNVYACSCMMMLFGMAGVGLWDDITKIVKQHNDGISKKQKLFGQTLVVIVVFMIYGPMTLSPTLHAPIIKQWVWCIGWPLFFVWAWLYVLFFSNATNFTDGLDGLVSVPMIFSCIFLGAVAYIFGHSVMAGYVSLPFVSGMEELAILCASLIGALLGFLWFNASPALFFMGDVGSLGIGGVMGWMALLVSQEFLFFLVGGVFCLEMISVVMQIIVFQTKKKRLFLMAPLHHHFEKKGQQETKIVVRFWIISFFFMLCGFVAIKMR